VLETAKRHAVTTTMDVLTPGDATAWSKLQRLLPYVDYFLPNEEQLAMLAGTSDISEAAREVLACGAQAVLVSRGEHGCSLVTSAQRADYSAFPAQVVDTTGCGDACSAGFIVGLLRGWTLEDAPWLAMAAASLAVGGLGSDAGIVDLDCTLEVIRQYAPPAVARRLS
jgi:sugar/nucleoside kinase (ribokinase family)